MKLRIAALLGVMLLAFAGAADAKKKKPKAHTNKLTGKIGGFPNTKVTAKIKVSKKGKPTKISALKVTGTVVVQCVNPATATVTPDAFEPGSLGKFDIIKVRNKGKTAYRFNIGGNAAGGRTFGGGGGLTSKKATKAKGAIVFQYASPTGAICNQAFQFTVKKKK